MFTWLNNLFPYSDLHSLNLDWILSKMKETAAQAAKAIADSANALAQVIEAKTAAQNAQTAASNAQTAASNAQTAANNAATSAENAVGVAQTAQTTAQNAQTAAQNAQTTAQNAHSTAQSAQSTAESAQSTAETAITNVETLNGKFPIKTVDIANQAVSNEKLQFKGFSKITTSALDASSSALFPSNTGASVSQISAELTGTGVWDFMNKATGEYLQFSIEFMDSSNITIKTIHCSFAPVYYPFRSRMPVYIPFIFENDNTSTVIKGYAKFKYIKTTDDYSFQMFFDVAPTFADGDIFIVRVKNIGAVMDLHF